MPKTATWTIFQTPVEPNTPQTSIPPPITPKTPTTLIFQEFELRAKNLTDCLVDRVSKSQTPKAPRKTSAFRLSGILIINKVIFKLKLNQDNLRFSLCY